jgi:hypothetical protein
MFTAVVAVAELFAALESVTPLATVAVLVTVPSAVVLTTTVAEALAPLASVPTLQVMTPPACAQTTVPVPVAETKVTLAGTLSVTVMAEAEDGPLLVTVMV